MFAPDSPPAVGSSGHYTTVAADIGWCALSDGVDLHAMVSGVNEDGTVNLAVLAENGVWHQRLNVSIEPAQSPAETATSTTKSN